MICVKLSGLNEEEFLIHKLPQLNSDDDEIDYSFLIGKDAFNKFMDQISTEEINAELNDIHMAKINLGKNFNFSIYENFFRTFAIYPDVATHLLRASSDSLNKGIKFWYKG